MTYVDGYLLAVPKKKLGAYKKLAQMFGKVARAHGATQYCECAGDDLKVKHGVPFTKLIKVKAGETVIFAWVAYKDRAARNKAFKAIMSDPRMDKMKDMPMPFDMKRMYWGGFKSIVDL